MARVYLVNHGVLQIAYSIDNTVGSGCVNNRDDVLLVQFFLGVNSQADSTYVPPGEAPLRIDGICGSHTVKYIQRYQQRNSEKNPGSPLTADGRIDPIKRGVMVGAASGRVLSMLALNFSYKNVRGSQAHANITRDPIFPAELRSAISLG